MIFYDRHDIPKNNSRNGGIIFVQVYWAKEETWEGDFSVSYPFVEKIYQEYFVEH